MLSVGSTAEVDVWYRSRWRSLLLTCVFVFFLAAFAFAVAVPVAQPVEPPRAQPAVSIMYLHWNVTQCMEYEPTPCSMLDRSFRIWPQSHWLSVSVWGLPAYSVWFASKFLGFRKCTYYVLLCCAIVLLNLGVCSKDMAILIAVCVCGICLVRSHSFET